MKIFVLILLFCSTGFAVTTTTLGNSKPLNLPDFSSLSKPAPNADGGFRVSYTCKDEQSNLLNKGDKGYEECLAKSQDAASKAQTGKK